MERHRDAGVMGPSEGCFNSLCARVGEGWVPDTSKDRNREPLGKLTGKILVRKEFYSSFHASSSF